jgi:hypothetical protein
MAKADQARAEIRIILVQRPNFLIRWGLTVLALIALGGYILIRLLYG